MSVLVAEATEIKKYLPSNYPSAKFLHSAESCDTAACPTDGHLQPRHLEVAAMALYMGDVTDQHCIEESKSVSRLAPDRQHPT